MRTDGEGDASSGAGGLDLALAADACPIPLVAAYSHPHLTILSSYSGFSSQATQQQHNQIKPTKGLFSLRNLFKKAL
jgi:hypothetical protein